MCMYNILSVSCLWHCIVQHNYFNCTLQLSNIDVTRGSKVVSYNKVCVSWTGINWLLPLRLFWSIWERVNVGKRSIQWSVNLPIPALVRKDTSSCSCLGLLMSLLEMVSSAVSEAISTTSVIQEEAGRHNILVILTSQPLCVSHQNHKYHFFTEVESKSQARCLFTLRGF